MKKNRRSLLSLLLISSLLLNACGVSGPDAISWSAAEPSNDFNDVENDPDLVVVDNNKENVGVQNSTEREIPLNDLLKDSLIGKDKVICTNTGDRSCFGDTFLGAKCIGDVCYVFVDGTVYEVPEDDALGEDGIIERVRSLQKDVKERYYGGAKFVLGVAGLILGSIGLVGAGAVATTTTAGAVVTSSGTAAVASTTAVTSAGASWASVGGTVVGGVTAVLEFFSITDNEEFSTKVIYLYQNIQDYKRIKLDK